MIRNLFLTLLLILTISVEGVIGQNSVKFEINDGLSNAPLKSSIEGTISDLLTEINVAQSEGRALKLAGMNITTQAMESMAMLWENVPFCCDEFDIVESCLESSTGYQVRNIPLIMHPTDGSATDGGYQEAVISFNASGTITSFYLTIGVNLYSKVMTDGQELGDVRRRLQILDYVEHFRTAYNQKDIPFLNNIFSEDALIITGTVVVARRADSGEMLQASVKYKKQDKQQYLLNLKRVFAVNNYINVQFDDIKVVAHPDPDRSNYYGVTLHQKWSTTNYSDEGTVFLLWDFNDEDQPVIHVRTWQPDYLDKAKQQRIDEDEIFTLSDFNL